MAAAGCVRGAVPRHRLRIDTITFKPHSCKSLSDSFIIDVLLNPCYT